MDGDGWHGRGSHLLRRPDARQLPWPKVSRTRFLMVESPGDESDAVVGRFLGPDFGGFGR